MTLYLGVDIGTFEAKGLLVEPGGRIVARAARRHAMRTPKPGWAEHDAEADWWGGFVAVTRALLATEGVDARRIRAIGLSAIGPCLQAIDADGRAIGPGILYGVDTRSSAEIEELTAQIGSSAVLDVCGAALTSQSIGPKILWLARTMPDVFARADRLVTSTTFLLRRLTGACAIDHYSAANTAPLYDLDALAYTDRLAPGLVDLARLPDLAWSTDVVGAVTPAAAAETGLPAGVRVICGTIDAAAEAVSVGVSEPGDTMLMYGSTVFLIRVGAARARDARLWAAPWLFAGRHAAMGGLATSGTLTHWFRERFARELPAETAFETLAAEAAAVPPGARGLVWLPYFSGERTPIHDPQAKGMLFGLDLTHGRGDVYRALLEGIAHGTAHALAAFAEAGAPPRRVRAVGGGVKNAVWLQATSDATGLAQEICAETIGASFGDAFLAAVGVGDARPDEIAAWNPVVRRVEPDPAARDAMARGQATFRALYERTRDLMHGAG